MQNYKGGYKAFVISDWMINYEGGFVRRGLIGEVLYLIYFHIHNYPLPLVIMTIYYTSFALFTVFFSKLLIRNGVSIFILPFAICLFIGLGVACIEGRRDYIALTITGLIFLTYYKLLTQKKKKYLFYLYALSILTILMHEASFFFTFPILMLHTLVYYYDKSSKLNCVKELITIWLPAVLTMMLVSYFKGSEDIAKAIWASWADCLYRYPLNGNEAPIGDGPQFLSFGLSDALKRHIAVSWNSPMHLVFNFYTFIAVYYLVTRINIINLKWYSLKSIDTTKLSNIMIVQFISLFPMFGFLSCDWGRTIPYWVISSLMLYCIIPTNSINSNIVINLLSYISTNIQNGLSRLKLLNYPLIYLFILISIPLDSFKGPNIWGSFLFIPYEWKLAVWILLKKVATVFM